MNEWYLLGLYCLMISLALIFGSLLLYAGSWYVEQYRKREMDEFRKSLKRGAKSIKQSMDEDMNKYAS